MGRQDKHAPVIGITTYGRNEKGDFHLPGAYADAVRKAGGLPLLQAPGEQRIAEILHLVDGLLFAGGGDIHPRHYGNVHHPAISRIDEERDAFELALAREAFHTRMPLLGICRGSQLLSVASGASLIAHLPDVFDGQVLHMGAKGEQARHTVHVSEDARLADIFATDHVEVISKHHQGLDESVGKQWRVAARAADGTIEAIEHKKHPWCLAVLWHPELAPQDEVQQRLFRAFVNAAEKMREVSF